MKSEFEIAITQVSADRNLSPQIIMEAIEAALVSAYKHNYGASQNVRVSLDPRTGQVRVYITKTVTEEVEEDQPGQILLADARAIEADAQIGESIEIEVKPRNFGRIAAQTAKQVITQRIREAERDSVYLEYTDRVGELVNGVVRNIDSRSRDVVISMGKAEALLPRNEQIPGEHYRFNQRLRVYIVGVERSGRGPQITISRSHRDLLRRLLELEVPEILNGTVEIKAIAREPGNRSKVAVVALQSGVDPVGSCVGRRGVRIQNIVSELNGEKIDVVEWDSDLQAFIGNSLSPARVLAVYLNAVEQTAKVVVPDRALSLAIGKEGQNARLAAKLTGWRIDIKSETEAAADAERLGQEMEEAAQRAREMEEARQAAAELLAEAEAGLEEETEEDEVVAEELVPLTVASEEADALDPSPEIEEPEPAEAEAEQVLAEQETPELPEGLPEPEVVAEPEEKASEEPQPAEEEIDPESWSVESLSDEGEEDEEQKARKKSRGRTLEYDEQLGQVVARKRRKPGRRSRDWEEWDEDVD